MSITLERESAVGIVRLNTPPANAYTRASLNELAQVILEIRADTTIRTVVVASAIDKFFCAGADISVLDGQDPHGFADFLALAHETVDMIEETPKIFIAAIAGHCIGGGLELALACDFRIAAEGKYGIGLGEVNLGLSPGMGGTQRLPRLIGAGHALHMMVTGEMLRPEQALDRGIVEWLHPTESHWDEVLAYADRLSDRTERRARPHQALDEARARRNARAGPRDGARQPGLPLQVERRDRRHQGVHGKAQARVHRQLGRSPVPTLCYKRAVRRDRPRQEPAANGRTAPRCPHRSAI